MVFYIAKGLQLAGLFGIGLALWVGVAEASLSRELFIAALSLGCFYAGRHLEQ